MSRESGRRRQQRGKGLLVVAGMAACGATPFASSPTTAAAQRAESHAGRVQRPQQLSPLVGSSDAGWTIVNSPDYQTGDTLNGATCVSASDCWAVGAYAYSGGSGTLVEQNTGSGWAIVSSPNIGTNDDALESVTCVTATDCWAVGSYNSSGKIQTLIEQYTASGWAVVSSPNLSSGSDYLYDVSCPSATDCWAVGSPGVIEQYSGTSWALISSPNAGTLYGATCLSATDCWAVGSFYNVHTGNTQTLVEQYNGTNWSAVASPSPSGTANQLWGVACVGASDCWATGSEQNNINVDQTLIERYTGSSWAVVASPSPGSNDNTLRRVTCTGAKDCWTVGFYAFGGPTEQTLTEHYAGYSWSVIASPDTNSTDFDYLDGVACPTAGNCSAVGTANEAGIGDQTLVEQYTPPTQQEPNGGPIASNELLGATNCSCANAELGQAYAGDPVDTAYGNYTETSTDLTIPGRGISLSFSRTYNSLAAGTNGPLGYGWASNLFMSLSQPGGNGPVTITQEGGAQVVFDQSGSSYTPAAPRVIATLTHNGDGTWTLQRLAQNTYVFSATGQLLSETDRNGYSTTLTYSGGSLSTITDPAGRTLSVGWNGGRVSTVTDDNVSPSRAISLQYNDGNGNLSDVIDVNGGHWHFTYDPSHRMTNFYDPICYAAGSACNAGNGIIVHYNGAGQVDWQKDQLGRETTFAYNGDPGSAAGGTTTITDPSGNVTVDTYQYGILTAQTKGYGTSSAATWQYLYNSTTAALQYTVEPDGGTTTYQVDGNGNVLAKEDPMGRETSATYNAFNEPLTQTDGLGVTTTYGYDGNGNRTSVSRPLLDSSGQVIATRTTQYKYADPAHPGDVTAMVDPDNNTWTYTYDAYGDQKSATDPLGDEATATYNADGWKLTAVTPRGNVSGCGCAGQYTTTYGYVDSISGKTDEFGDVATVTDPLGHVAANHYDADRDLSSATDASGNTTSHTFDLANEETAVTRADHSVTHTDYYADGTIQDEKDGKGSSVVSFGYDPLARVVTQTDALSNMTTYGYDPAGNGVSKQDPGGNCGATPPTGCTTMSYDADNELTGVTYSDGVTPNVSNVTYDAAGERVRHAGRDRYLDLVMGQPQPPEHLHRRQWRPGAVPVQPTRTDHAGQLSGEFGRDPRLRQRRTLDLGSGLAEQHHDIRL